MAVVRSADGTQIAYEVTGSGPAVVMIDAAGGYRDFNSLRPLADLLAKDGFTTYTYDRRGRGASTDAGDYAVEREIEDIAAVIAEAGGEAMIYGWSSGALLGVRAAAAGLPITKLALFEPPYGSEEAHDAETLATLKTLVAEDRRGDVVDLFHTAIGVPPEILAGMEPIKPMLEAIAPTYVYDWQIAATTTTAHMASVRVPAFVLDSTATGPEMNDGVDEIVKALPHSTHKRFEGEWHDLPIDVLAPELAAFYKS
ncbi:MAG: alpha/beta hydrolase [Kibdelosporangium sp.]